MATDIVEAGTSQAPTLAAPGWERYAWLAGIFFVLAVLVESAIGLGVGINQNDSASKIANTLADHRNRLVVVEGFCVVYAAMLPIYLWKLYERFLHADGEGSRALGSLMLVGGMLFVALHAFSDIGVYGVLDGKLAVFGAHHDRSVSYTLYLLTYAVDSVADVFGSLFALAAGVLVFRSGVFPRWLGWVSILAAPLALSAGLRSRRRDRIVWPGSRPHRIRAASRLRPDHQHRGAQERVIGWRPR